MANDFSKSVNDFLFNLDPEFTLPEHFQFLFPYEDPQAVILTRNFNQKFYSGNKKRKLILGINPGRFGGGTTGIAFTDPVRLETICGITNSLNKRAELSSIFIYEMINEYGGVQKFYQNFFLNSVCPVGFIKNGKNINFYDDKNLLDASTAWIEESLWQLTKMEVDVQTVYCLGEGKNYLFLKNLNERISLFSKIVPLAHPRFIMQYRRKNIKEYINNYIRVLNE